MHLINKSGSGTTFYSFIFQYNMNRRYGLKTLPHLFANWKQVYTDLDILSSHQKQIGLADSLFVLEKVLSKDELYD